MSLFLRARARWSDLFYNVKQSILDGNKMSIPLEMTILSPSGEYNNYAGAISNGIQNASR